MKRPRTQMKNNPTIPKAQPSANETAVRAAYTENVAKVKTMLEGIRKRLHAHATRFEASRRAGRVDWGYVGDLGHVATLVTEISDFLGKE